MRTSTRAPKRSAPTIKKTIGPEADRPAGRDRSSSDKAWPPSGKKMILEMFVNESANVDFLRRNLVCGTADEPRPLPTTIATNDSGFG
jgi:hypothetical protein